MGKVWADGPAGGTPIDAASLNDFETRIATLETGGGGGGGLSSVDYTNLPAGVPICMDKVAGVWPARRSDRADLKGLWFGPDPSPPIVASGTGGMLAGDVHFVTP